MVKKLPITSLMINNGNLIWASSSPVGYFLGFEQTPVYLLRVQNILYVLCLLMLSWWEVEYF